MKKPIASLPLVILHGWAVNPDNQAKWQPLIEKLTRSGKTVRFLGLPGLTTALKEVWQLSDYVHWLDQQLNGQRVVLIGHSFGGQLAVRFTTVFPQQVERLILIDSAGIRPFTSKAKIKRLIFSTVAKLGKAVFPFEFGRVILHKLAREKDYLYASPILRKTMQNVLEDEVLGDLAALQVTTCLIWGAQDSITPLTHGRLFAKNIPQNQLHIILGARHSPQFTHVQQVADQILAFLTETDHHQK